MNAKFQNRRDFIKTTAVAAAAVPFVGALSPRIFAAEPDKKLGVALVGLGNLSTHQIAPALQNTKYCRLTGIVTGTPAKAEKWKAQYNLPDRSIYNYDTMEKMADNPDIDIVYVVTPNALHAEHTIKAAGAGKHVLCEKPMEVSAERCQQMIDACKKAGRQLAIGYRSRFDPHNIECIRLAREKVFGKLRIIEACFEIHLDQPPSAWRFHKDLSGGGCLMDVGIYALQATRYITGEEPILVSGMETKDRPGEIQGSGGIHRLAGEVPQRHGRLLQRELQFRSSSAVTQPKRTRAGLNYIPPSITAATAAGAATAGKSGIPRWTRSGSITSLPPRWTISRNAS